MATVQEKIKRVLDSRPNHVFTPGEILEKLDLGYSPSGELRKMVERGTAKMITFGHYQSSNGEGESRKPAEKGVITARISMEVELTSTPKGVLVKENGITRRLPWTALLKLAEERGEVISEEC